MSTGTWEWWLKSDAGLAARIAVGAAIFAGLAGWDLYRNGRKSRRCREYAFLVAAAVLAMAYGALNDAITSQISWEYFYYGKELAGRLGPQVPPAPGPLLREAVKTGMRAAWSAGLIVGVALLLANNPRGDRPQLPYRRLLKLLAVISIAAAACAAILGAAGYAGGLTWMSGDFRLLVHDGVFRPRRLLCTYGVHLGGYVGGVGGTAWAVWKVLRERKHDSIRDLACKVALSPR